MKKGNAVTYKTMRRVYWGSLALTLLCLTLFVVAVVTVNFTAMIFACISGILSLPGLMWIAVKG